MRVLWPADVVNTLAKKFSCVSQVRKRNSLTTSLPILFLQICFNLFQSVSDEQAETVKGGSHS
jgi:hypothetical protein